MFFKKAHSKCICSFIPLKLLIYRLNIGQNTAYTLLKYIPFMPHFLSLINPTNCLYLSACLYNEVFDWRSVPPSAGIVLGTVKWFFIRWNGLGFVSITSLKTALNVHGCSNEIQRWGYFYTFAILEFRYFWPFFAVFFFHQNTTTHRKDIPFPIHNFLVNKQLWDDKFKRMFLRYPWKPRKPPRIIVDEG